MSDSQTHTASRTIIASQRAIFRTFLDLEAVSSWRAPKGMTAKILEFDPRPGGIYKMAFIYSETDHGRGKSTADADIFEGRFVELVPDELIVEEVRFESGNAAFAGTMRVTTTFLQVTGGTKVTIRAENVPPGISAADHRAGMASTLKNLANFIE